MSNIVGSFYFKRDDNIGNLTGHFSNNKSDEIMIERATLNSNNTNSFVGIYESEWFDTSFHVSNLIITQVKDKFFLRWVEPQNASYLGQGFLVDGILIGSYRQVS